MMMVLGRRPGVFSSVLIGLSVLSLGLTSCNPEKARALQGAALQFQEESIAAIEAIAVMREREIEAVPRSDAAVEQEFIQNILGFDGQLDASVVDFAINPYEVDLSPDVEAQWQAFISQLRSQYNTFGLIYDDLQVGAIPPVDAVAESTAIAKKLTAQMAVFASILEENPPILIQHRSAVLVDLDDARQVYRQLQIDLSRERETLGNADKKIAENQQAIVVLQQQIAALNSDNTNANQSNTLRQKLQNLQQQQQNL